jgi:hypothetical protein
MSALCWGCTNGVPRVGVAAGPPLDPLGACWECGVFGCHGHAERDGSSGKWHCYSSVATALGVSAGLLHDPTIALHFSSSEDFQRRFPKVAEATRAQREFYRSGDGEGKIGSLRERHELVVADWWLYADAIGVSTFLLGGDLAATMGFDATGERSDVIPLRMYSLIRELDNA